MEYILPQTFQKGSSPAQNLDFKFLASRTVRITFCCVKPRGSEYFVMVALGNQYRCASTYEPQSSFMS